MLTKTILEDCRQNDDDLSCVAGVTLITGPWFISQDRRSNLPEFFQHAVEEAATGSKKKPSVDTLSHMQYFVHASNHDPINWEDLTHYHMTHVFGVNLQLTSVSMHGIRQGLSLLMGIHKL